MAKNTLRMVCSATAQFDARTDPVQKWTTSLSPMTPMRRL